MSDNKTFTSLREIEEYIKKCQLERLKLDDNEVWRKAYVPASQITDNPGVYEGRVEFRRIHIRLISSNEPLMGCGPLPDWLRGKRCIYSIDSVNDNLCVWRCLVIFKRIRRNRRRPEEDRTREAPNLVRKFYNQPKLQVRDVRATKLVDFENIASKFKVNIRLYKRKDQSTWKLVFGQNQFKSSLPNVDIGLYEGYCFYI